MKSFDLGLYLVTDRDLSLGRPLEFIVEEAVKGGVTMVQLREKACSSLEFYQLGIRLKKLLKPYAVPLIINDRLDIALAVDADGLHIGQSDLPWEVARRLLGKDKILGLSVETMEQAEESNKLDIDYIGISPVFATPTKTDTFQPFGLEGVKAVSSIARHPNVAIGGINMNNAAQVMAQGANGIAVVSAISSAENPRLAAEALKNEVTG
ncbi:thiamine-phosphate pyrophosphorylase [Mariniphaga anaerophila]|uniref:Thiamine-phosphate synthase n=1 Tax=Mariniphaga anaerophila TaxID=1484053 RepID=A0A1M4VUQ8_9BACT|nr:thiamine phosphate synthase [Mariniphaga anaerophila]SHE72512.1 thiamine-phosphate pyrophosphorylase [Mariniphaga anaerophila]